MAQTLAPKQAAALLGKSEETLRRWRVQGKGPPFVMEGGKPRYRSDLLQAGTYAVQGRQVTFPAPANPEETTTTSDLHGADLAAGGAVPAHRVVAIIERWKRRELHRRAQKIMEEPFADDREFEEEIRMFGEAGAEGDLDTPADEIGPARGHAVITALDQLETAVSCKLQALWEAEGLPPSLLRQQYQVASTLLEDAWREVVSAHERWLDLDYTGMPSDPPP